jgi:hypothetical protein
VSEATDRLYQLPLAEFTAARNALAKSAGKDGAAIKALEKPSLPAWAVNQLYWTRRKAFDRLIEAARRLRVEHGRQLAGKAADVAVAERAHRTALSEAVQQIRGLLQQAGEAASPATMTSVTDTLQAVPGRDDHGRLTKALRPLGFEALSGLVPRGGAAIARLAEVPAPVPQAPPRPDGGVRGLRQRAREDARAAAARRKAAAAAERALREARLAERTARAAHARAEGALARAQRERARLQSALDETTSRRDALIVEVMAKKKDADRAASERERLEFARAAQSKHGT